jgi:hypothetical protein
MTAQFHQDGRFGPIQLVYLGHFLLKCPYQAGKILANYRMPDTTLYVTLDYLEWVGCVLWQ